MEDRFNNIRIKVNKYKLNISKSDDRVKYEKIKAECNSLGYTLFDTYSSGRTDFYDNLPKEGIIDTDFLFKDQYNLEKYRVHDWSEAIFSNRDIKQGYYLTGNIELLNEAKNNQLCCGWCGKRHWKNDIDFKFCKACINSEHLTVDRLFLLKLTPVNFKGKVSNVIPKELLKEFNDRGEALEENRRKRLKNLAIEKTEKLKESQKLELYELSVQTALLNAGIDTENLIFYAHSGEWAYGWRSLNEISQADFENFRNSCEGVNIPLDENGIEFLNLLKFKR